MAAMLSTNPPQTRLREEVLSSLWKLYPQHCVILTDPRTRPAIDVGIARAARHGFRESMHVRPFVSLMIFLGSHFDEDPQLAWAAESLRTTARASRGAAIGDLLGETSRRMEPLVGGRGEYYRRALAWSGARSFDTIAADHDDTDAGLHHFLRQLHRRKYDALGDDAVNRLLLAARSAAQRHGLTTPPGLVVYLGLIFLLGSGLDQDPFHPWAGDALAPSTASDPTHKARELHTTARETLRRFTRLDELMRADASKG
jgi:hypothetical protein